jgi:hypothetical protein
MSAFGLKPAVELHLPSVRCPPGSCRLLFGFESTGITVCFRPSI